MESNTLYLIMGVSGCGKTTIGQAFAIKLGIPFYDGDDFHSEVNVSKMSSGQSLNDADRQPWLESINKFAAKELESSSLVIACSALKEKYRCLLSVNINIVFIYLRGSKELIGRRIEKRENHFMPLDLLDSQFKTLEEPTNAIVVNINENAETIIKKIISKIRDK